MRDSTNTCNRLDWKCAQDVVEYKNKWPTGKAKCVAAIFLCVLLHLLRLVVSFYAFRCVFCSFCSFVRCLSILLLLMPWQPAADLCISCMAFVCANDDRRFLHCDASAHSMIRIFKDTNFKVSHKWIDLNRIQHSNAHQANRTSQKRVGCEQESM